MRTRVAPGSDRGAPARKPGLAWLVRLRWLAVIGQLVATAAAIWIVEAPVELPWLFGLIAVTALSNAALALMRPTRDRLVVVVVLVVDTLLLTGMLAASGGAMNPFSIFFIVQVALAGLLVGARGAWAMAALTSLAFGALFVLAPDDPHAHHHHGATLLHLQGMWVAYTLAAAFTALFVSGIATALQRRERELAALRERALATERLAALSAFSASAAHELGTPLSTIAIVATELAHALAREGQSALADDARVVRAEVERCRGLLRDLAERAGTWAGEAPESATAEELMRAVGESLPVGGRARMAVVGDVAVALRAPKQSLVRSLANLVKNALEVQPGPVEVAIEARPESVRFRVRDRGPGFAPDVLARFGEPFVTTKPRGEGLGLGLYLALSFASSVGGALNVESRGDGSEVTLEVPRAAATGAAT